MPVTGPDSYIPTTNEIIAHWNQVNIALGGTPATELKLSGNYAVANMTTDRNALQAANDAVEAARNALETAYGLRDNAKAILRPRIAQMRASVEFVLARSGYPRSLPRQPNIGAGESDFLRPFSDIQNLWTTINADTTVAGFTPPLTLIGGYALATFTTDLTALRTLFYNVDAALANLKISYDKRDVLLIPLKARLLEYRKAVLARFGAGNQWVTSLPRVTPTPGPQPPGMNVLSAEWDKGDDKGKFVWEKITNAEIVAVIVAYCPGATYNANNEQILAELPATDTTFETVVGLPAEGSIGLYKVYSKSDAGRTKGSKTLKIVRGS